MGKIPIRELSLIIIFGFLFRSITLGKEKEHPLYPVPRPPFSEGVFPCSNCHGQMKANKKRRSLEFHQDINLKHAEAQRWCLDCHDADNRDRLRLANGDPVKFEESYYLCGQCHGTIFRDWKAGIHGRRTGMWNGPKQYLLCVHCHNPHEPRFKPIKPMPPPLRPDKIRSEKVR